LRQHGLGGAPEVLLDPDTFSDDGTVSLSMLGVTDDGEHLAYGTSSSGSDWITIRVMRVQDKQLLPDKLSWVKFSRIAWTQDGKGFFYSRFPDPRLVFVRLSVLCFTNHSFNEMANKLVPVSSFGWQWCCLVSRDGGTLDSGINTNLNLNHEVYYHFLGTDQSEDVLCWKDSEHPKHIYSPQVTEDGKVFKALKLYTHLSCVLAFTAGKDILI
jgi:prolyl oligopeptidase